MYSRSQDAQSYYALTATLRSSYYCQYTNAAQIDFITGQGRTGTEYRPLDASAGHSSVL